MKFGSPLRLVMILATLPVCFCSCADKPDEELPVKPVLNNPNRATQSPNGVLNTRHLDLADDFRLPDDGGLPTNEQLAQGRESERTNQGDAANTSQPSTVIRPTAPKNTGPKPDEDQLDSE